jgi:hypothetical protein
VLGKLTGDRKIEDENRARGVLNDILLWGIALDFRWGCEEVNGELLPYFVMTKNVNQIDTDND